MRIADQKTSTGAAKFTLALLATAAIASLLFPISSGPLRETDPPNSAPYLWVATIVNQITGLNKAADLVASKGMDVEQLDFRYDNFQDPRNFYRASELLPQSPPQAAYRPDVYNSPIYRFAMVGVDGIGTDAPDLVTYLVDMRPRTCRTLHRQLYGEDAVEQIPVLPVSMAEFEAKPGDRGLHVLPASALAGRPMKDASAMGDFGPATAWCGRIGGTSNSDPDARFVLFGVVASR